MDAPRLTRLAALTLLAFAGPAGAGLAADQAGATTSNANLRNGPGTSYAVVAALDPGTDLVVHACTGTWCAVTTGNDGNGFLAKSLIDFDTSADAASTPAPATDSQVCFYQGPGFSDASFCAQPGDSDNRIPRSFDDTIESILISGDAIVDVCTGPGLHGDCRTFDHSTRRLPLALRDNIASYSVDAADSDAAPPTLPGDTPDDTPDTLPGFTLN